MSRDDTKAEVLREEVFRGKAAGEINRQITESHGLKLKQLKKLAEQQSEQDAPYLKSHPGRNAPAFFIPPFLLRF